MTCFRTQVRHAVECTSCTHRLYSALKCEAPPLPESSRIPALSVSLSNASVARCALSAAASLGAALRAVPPQRRATALISSVEAKILSTFRVAAGTETEMAAPQDYCRVAVHGSGAQLEFRGRHALAASALAMSLSPRYAPSRVLNPVNAAAGAHKRKTVRAHLACGAVRYAAART
jgi:hypothetical protein